MSFLPRGREVTVHRAGSYDAHGNRRPGTSHTIASCAFDQQDSATTNDGSIAVTTEQRLLCDDVNADVQADDILHLSDDTWWKVVGKPKRMRSPFDGWEPGCTIPVEETAPLRTTQT